MDKKKKKSKSYVPEEEEIEETVGKGKQFIRKERAVLEKDAEKIKEFVGEEVRVGKKFVRKEKVRLEAWVHLSAVVCKLLCKAYSSRLTRGS